MAALLLIAAPMQAQTRKKLIYTGWDNPTTAQVARDWKAMEATPFDGFVVMPIARDEKGQKIAGNLKFRQAFENEAWQPQWFDQSIRDLQQVRSSKITDIFVELLGNPGGVDFFDDAAWKNIVQHWQIAARVAKQGGVRGILFDAERYTEPFEQTSQFWYRAQKNKDKHSFAQYQSKARQRGREVMQAVAREYPDITILNYFLASYTLEAVRSPDPQPVLEEQTYGLLMSFLDGWLDVAPPGVKIVDGNENSYYYTDIGQFFRDALEIKVAGQNVVAPENRFKYRAQVQAGHALYLDRFAAKPGEKYFFDIGNTPKSTKIAEHATAALASSDEYVWIYGEKGRFWPEPGALLQWQGKEVFAPWPQVLAGSDTALSIARDPHRAALDFLRAHPTAPNLARNADFSSQSIAPDKNAVQNAADWQGDGAVAGWLTWQDDDSRGTFSWDKAIGAKSPGAARLSAISNGCFIQTYPVQAGKSFVLSAKVRQSGKGYSQITARWKDQNNAWTAQTSDVPLFATGAADAKGWRTIAGLVVVPPSATQMVLLLTAQGQKTGADQIWFDDVQVIEQTIE